MPNIDLELAALANHMGSRREAILQSWQSVIRKDPALSTGDSLPRGQLFDHIPAILATYERELQHSPRTGIADGAGQEPAAAHGLQRWRQGYDLREVTRELGKLNECVVAEFEATPWHIRRSRTLRWPPRAASGRRSAAPASKRASASTSHCSNRKRPARSRISRARSRKYKNWSSNEPIYGGRRRTICAAISASSPMRPSR